MTIHYVALSLVTLFAITSATGNSNVTNVEGDLSRSEHVEMDSGATLNVKEVTESRRRMAESTFISEHGKCLHININFIYSTKYFKMGSHLLHFSGNKLYCSLKVP